MQAVWWGSGAAAVNSTMEKLQQLGRAAMVAGVSTRELASMVQDIAHKWDRRLREDNERQQREAEQSTNEQMNHTIRSLR